MSINPETDKTLSLIVKINFLVLGLGLVIYGIYFLNNKGLPAPVASAIGVPVQKKSFLNWCDTRVKSMSLANGRRVYQQGRKWMAEGGIESGELDFIAVEKWFGNNCKRSVTGHVGEVRAQALVASVEFIDGAQAEFKADGQGLLIWKGRAFASPELESAFLELMELPVVD